MRKVSAVQKAPFPMPDVVTKGVPAPTDGWDAISPLADMDPKRAPILNNFVPRPGWVELRQGYTPWVTGLTGGDPVETLMVLRQPTGEKMVAASNGHIFNVSSSGTFSSIASGLTNNRWQYTNFTPPGGTTVIQMVNGADTLRQWDGTSFTTPSITGFPNSWTTANIVNIYAAKQILWYVMLNSTIVAFMPVGAISGPIQGFQDFGTLFNKGGFVVAVFDWTIDGGEGPNAYTGFISNQGQVALYQGVDPANTSLWSFVGTFDLAPPIGYRCATKIGSDVALITYQGLLQISQALPYDPSADRSAALTARIQNAMNLAVQQWAGNFGWQFITFPLQQLGFLNVPQIEDSVAAQYVTNMLTGAWCQFTNWNANCWELYKQNLFFGDSSGNVQQAYFGSSDNGTAIPGDMQCAFNWFDDPGREKRITMVQPLLTADGQISPSIGINVDFASVAPTQATQILAGGARWGSAIWGTSLWGGGLVQVTAWQTVTSNPGKALAVRMATNVAPSGTNQITLQVNSFNAIMELGGFI